MEAKPIVAGIVAFGLMMGLVACAPIHISTDGMIEPGTSASSAAEPPAALEGDSNDDGVLSEFEKQVLAQNAPRDFAMPDGSTVEIDPKEPLPAAVKDILVEQAQPIGNLYKSNTDFSPESIGALHSQLKGIAESQSAMTGKPVVIVFPSPNGSGGTQWIAIPSGHKSTGIVSEPNRDSMVVKVQSWAKPRGYEVIVLS